MAAGRRALPIPRARLAMFETMLSVDGASLLAQLIPVGLLVLAVEARAGYKLEPGIPIWLGRVFAWVVFAVALLALPALFFCAMAVINGDAIADPLASIIKAAATALYLIAGAIAALLARDVFRPEP